MTSVPRRSSEDLPFDKKRIIVLHEADWTCVKCGAEATEADHIWPRSYGGSDALDNLQALCRSCNASKGATIYIDDLTVCRVGMYLPLLTERAVKAIERLARWQATLAALVDGAAPIDAGREFLTDEPYSTPSSDVVRQVLADLWCDLLGESPGHAALDALLSEADELHVIDAAEADRPLNLVSVLFPEVMTWGEDDHADDEAAS